MVVPPQLHEQINETEVHNYLIVPSHAARMIHPQLPTRSDVSRGLICAHVTEVMCLLFVFCLCFCCPWLLPCAFMCSTALSRGVCCLRSVHLRHWGLFFVCASDGSVRGIMLASSPVARLEFFLCFCCPWLSPCALCVSRGPIPRDYVPCVQCTCAYWISVAS